MYVCVAICDIFTLGKVIEILLILGKCSWLCAFLEHSEYKKTLNTAAMLLGSNWQFYACFWTFFAEFFKQINHKNKILTSQ